MLSEPVQDCLQKIYRYMRTRMLIGTAMNSNVPGKEEFLAEMNSKAEEFFQEVIACDQDSIDEVKTYMEKLEMTEGGKEVLHELFTSISVAKHLPGILTCLAEVVPTLGEGEPPCSCGSAG